MNVTTSQERLRVRFFSACRGMNLEHVPGPRAIDHWAEEVLREAVRAMELVKRRVEAGIDVAPRTFEDATLRAGCVGWARPEDVHAIPTAHAPNPAKAMCVRGGAAVSEELRQVAAGAELALRLAADEPQRAEVSSERRRKLIAAVKGHPGISVSDLVAVCGYGEAHAGYGAVVKMIERLRARGVPIEVRARADGRMGVWPRKTPADANG